MNHKDLDVWKEGISLVTDIYQIAVQLPGTEKFGLSSQLKRAAVSIPTNIAEGSGRNSDKEMIQFLYISLGSLEEIETLLIISVNLGYFKNEEIENIYLKIIQIRKLLIGLIKYLKNKHQ